MSDIYALSGSAGFAAVIHQWKAGEAPAGVLNDPPYARLSAALLGGTASAADLHVLLRHALRYESLRREQGSSAVLPKLEESLARLTSLTAIRVSGGSHQVTADPWQPKWLESAGVAVDQGAMRAERRRFGDALAIPSDPLLASVGFQAYRSLGQRNAIRAAISMPAGASLIVDLPTGEGKSLVFRLLAEVGFSATRSGVLPGLVVVVVPTVTLALDHERSWGDPNSQPLAYVGGRHDGNARIREAIENGTQRVIFAAPEAIVRSLRTALDAVSRAGQLGAVVIDEAHLIDGWGTGFRTEFQTLAGALAAWRSKAPAESQFRTIFLSATLNEGSIETIGDLFSPQAPIPIVSGAAIRPEPEYWVGAPADSPQRIERVEEALWHLPRPLILYVTKVTDAEYWNRRLRDLGFRRYAMVHGGTLGDERDRVLRAWADARIDVVVATSAFGLGIDYPHVRAIVHACLPETLDRFYQEVGRGGRDGCGSISLLIPDYADQGVAKSLSLKKVITVDRGLDRWRAMFTNPARRAHGSLAYSVPIDIAPGASEDDIDLVGERSTDWNQRTLALMARAGLIRLLGAELLDGDQVAGPSQFERLELLEDRPSDPEVWRDRVEPVRQRIMAHSATSFEFLQRFVRDRQCPARLLAQLYARPDAEVAIHCSSCALCRQDPEQRAPDGVVPQRPSPWTFEAELAELLLTTIGPAGNILVSYPRLDPKERVKRETARMMQRLDQFGIRNLICIGDLPQWLVDSTQSALAGRPWVSTVSDRWSPFRWPTGPRLVLCSEVAAPGPRNLRIGPAMPLQIFFCPTGTTDPDQPERQLDSVFPGRTTTLERFMAEILQ